MLIGHIVLEELLWQAFDRYVRNFNIFKMFTDVSNTIQNFVFMAARVSEIAGGGGAGRPSLVPKSLVQEGLRKNLNIGISLSLFF